MKLVSEWRSIATPLNPPSQVHRWIEAQNPRWVQRSRVALYLAFILVTWWARWVQDDAFITYRFARNAARGHGLVFNPGERVEGYTNFLWTAIHVIPEKLGWSAPLFSVVVGMCAGVVALFLAERLFQRVTRSPAMALFATAVLACMGTFFAYGTSGMETMTQTAALLGVAVLLVPDKTARDRPAQRELGASVVAAVAILTRLDSAVLVAAWFGFVLWHEMRTSGFTRRLGLSALRLVAPMVAVLIPWLWWKQSYYGSIIPNTFHAKASDDQLVPRLWGVGYLVTFLLGYGVVFLIPRIRRVGRRWVGDVQRQFMAIGVVAWCCYVVYVGADFMEYRFMVPIMAPVALAIAKLLDSIYRPVTWIALVAIMGLLSVGHRVSPAPLGLTAPIETLNHWPIEAPTTWRALGEHLHEWFPGGDLAPGQPRLGLAALGVVSYYSDLPAVDMLGLTDADIARDGKQFPVYVPGHVREARLEQLIDKGVDLVIGLPVAGPSLAPRTSYSLTLAALRWAEDLRPLVGVATVVEIPTTNGLFWPALRLTKNDKVQYAIDHYGWREFPIDASCGNEGLNALELIASDRSCPDR